MVNNVLGVELDETYHGHNDLYGLEDVMEEDGVGALLTQNSTDGLDIDLYDSKELCERLMNRLRETSMMNHLFHY